MINALVFDVDGVLVENKVFASVLEREYGISREMTAPFFHGPFEDCVLGRADLREALPAYLGKWKWPGSLDEFIRTWFEADARVNQPMLAVYQNDARRREALLYRQHARAPTGCLSGKAAGVRRAVREALLLVQSGLSKAGEAVLRPDPVRDGPETADELLFLDDHEPNVAGAREAGWNAELYQWGMDLGEVMLKYNIHYPSA